MSPDVRSHIDEAERTAVITTAFDHPADVVWTLFSDPAKLARWWGPPGMPIAIDRHDLRAGGAVELTVSTTDGEVRGRWAIHEVDPPHTLHFTFSSDGLDPTEIAVDISARSDGSATLTITARFTNDDTFHHALAIGFVAGVVRSCAEAHTALAVG